MWQLSVKDIAASSQKGVIKPSKLCLDTWPKWLKGRMAETQLSSISEEAKKQMKNFVNEVKNQHITNEFLAHPLQSSLALLNSLNNVCGIWIWIWRQQKKKQHNNNT